MIDEFAHDLEAMWRRLRGHGYEGGHPAMQQRNGPVIHEILDPEFLLAQLDHVKDEGREVHALHLGDVYYSGWKEEYRARFLPYWPVGPGGEGVRSWAINGNHDMYSGGHGFFGYLLADPRFAAQNGSSYFCLENEHWQILGLDTAYTDKDLAGDQQQWLKGKLDGSGRKTMLLTHHQAYSAFETVDHKFIPKVLEAFGERTIDAWLWGHEHMCCAYRPQPDGLPLDFSTCIGHGGVPVLLNEGDTPKTVSWRFEKCEVHEGQDKWQLFGFAVLDFEGPHITLRYFDQNGNKNEELTIGGNHAQQTQQSQQAQT